MVSNREVINTGRRLTERILSKSSILVSVIGEKLLMPTLLIMISRSPHSFRICRTQFSNDSLLLTSTLWNMLPVSFAVCWPDASFVSQKATRQSAWENASTIALPIPSAPPVINTLLFESSGFETVEVWDFDSAGRTAVSFFLPLFLCLFPSSFSGFVLFLLSLYVIICHRYFLFIGKCKV